MSSPGQNTDSNTYAVGQSEDVLKNFSLRTVENSAPYLLPFLRSESVVLDLGCGPGSITADFARRCPNGRVVGIDSDATAIAAARRAHNSGDGPDDETEAEFVLGDAVARLPFDDATFDILHGHQFAQFVADVPGAMAEWRRVLKPGGVLGLRVAWLRGMATCPPHTGAFVGLANAMDGMYRASGGDPCVLQSGLPSSARAVGLEVDVRMDATAVQQIDLRKIIGSFFLSDALIAGWKKLGVMDDEKVQELRAAIKAIEEAEHGFYILPSIDAVCRMHD